MADNSGNGSRPTLAELGVIERKVDPETLRKLYEELMKGDAEEQHETFEALKKGLDEHRPEGYKLFPEK
jgi:hypothetical protein